MKPLAERFAERTRPGAKPATKKRAVALVAQALDDLDRDLGDAVKALDSGEIGSSDFAWEDELTPNAPPDPTTHR